MTIKKRTLPQYILLNCLTLGIYGFIVWKDIDKEINALCKGDGEQPKFSYAGAVFLRGIATIVGIIVGFIVGLVGIDQLDFLYFLNLSDLKVAVVFLCMLIFGAFFTLIGSFISGLYLKFWWYKQAGRLKLNAHRYGITVKETGTDNFIYHTVLEAILVPITIVTVVLSCAIPLFIIWLITLANSTGAVVFASILLFVFSDGLCFFYSYIFFMYYHRNGYRQTAPVTFIIMSFMKLSNLLILVYLKLFFDFFTDDTNALISEEFHKDYV